MVERARVQREKMRKNFPKKSRSQHGIFFSQGRMPLCLHTQKNLLHDALSMMRKERRRPHRKMTKVDRFPTNKKVN